MRIRTAVSNRGVFPSFVAAETAALKFTAGAKTIRVGSTPLPLPSPPKRCPARVDEGSFGRRASCCRRSRNGDHSRKPSISRGELRVRFHQFFFLSSDRLCMSYNLTLRHLMTSTATFKGKREGVPGRLFVDDGFDRVFGAKHGNRG